MKGKSPNKGSMGAAKARYSDADILFAMQM
jgi:hypothetical protein